MFQTDPFALIALLVGLSLVAFVAMVATSYLKIVVVVSLIRNALGIQSVPPNMVVNALALILTFYIMAPVAGESWELYNRYRSEDRPEKEYRTDLALKAAEPFREWLVRQTSDRERAFFVTTAERLWAKPGEDKAEVDPESFHILILDLLLICHKLAYRTVVHMVAKSLLCLHLVTVRNSHIVHLVAETEDKHILCISPSCAHPHPYGYPLQCVVILPMADNHLATDTHTGAYMAELTVTVSGLVQVHEIHVHSVPWNLLVVLGMEMHERLLELEKTMYPHLCR